MKYHCIILLHKEQKNTKKQKEILHFWI